MIDLPADVLYLICEELGENRQDFRTLFNCALAGRTLTAPALYWLYRVHNHATVINSEGNDADFTRNETFQARTEAAKRTVSKWALQWKSIIRSSLRNTAYPYCLYIRSLDLRNLADLLEDPTFQKNFIDTFFANDMAGFHKTQQTPIKQKMRGSKASYKRIDIPLVLELVGESITSFVSESASQSRTTVALEELSGNIRATALPKWVERLSRLKSMTIWDGAILNGSVGYIIENNCHNFDDLTFFTCVSGDVDRVDHDLSSFFRGLKKNSLRSFAALSANAIGSETLLALNHHAQFLKKLKLDGLKSEAIKNLSLLQGCNAIETLEIQDADGLISLEATENDVFLEVISWLGNCNNLRELLMRNLVSGPAILTQVCLKNEIRLRKLQVVGYSLVDNQDFHKALSHQTTLESLELRADPEGAFRDDIDTLINSISKLRKLRYLNLTSTSDYFRTHEILILAVHLVNLEELWFGGYDVTDELWRGMANLFHLRALNISAITSFSANGILAYISTLKATNQGLLLSVMSQKSENALSEREETAIRQSIADKVDGKFDFTLFREPGSDSELFSD